ncbi:Nicotinamide riboside transporter PnuC [Lacunisphaera limnophila]|uniref:Nicotinamide riboside transporter PnuC n=1 Tax=Lacunisphaera limnophila TaxID=1838286 RepID=A0A1D8AYY5_9BACT|nr:nicotinamide riboside transporter PnuC [Lacunisphaera limnophila]AOS46108.1 Nicotinamide riboside transporter PnuC [Lacunisphaera limnophila]
MSITEPIVWEFLPAWIQVSPCELVGAVFGFASVYLTIKNRVWLWPTGIISVLAYAWLFRAIKLYPDMVLQVLFFLLSVQGWIRWRREPDADAAIRILTPRQGLLLLAGIGIAYSLTGASFAYLTSSSMPWWDSAILVLSLFAQALLTFHFRENWYLWITVDLIALYVYAVKDLRLTLILYALFLAMAILGCISWHKKSAGRSSRR